MTVYRDTRGTWWGDQVRLYTPGDLLIMYGELGRELFIIENGIAQPITPDGEPIGNVMLKKDHPTQLIKNDGSRVN